MKLILLLIAALLFASPLAAQSHFILNDFGNLEITGNNKYSLKVAFMDTSLLRTENRYKQQARFTGAATLYLYADTSDTVNSPADTAGTYTLTARRLDDQMIGEVDTLFTFGSGVAWDPGENATRPRIFDIHTNIGIVGYEFILTRAGATGTATFNFKVLYQRYDRR